MRSGAQQDGVAPCNGIVAVTSSGIALSGEEQADPAISAMLDACGWDCSELLLRMLDDAWKEM